MNKKLYNLLKYYKSHRLPAFIIGCIIGLFFFLCIYGGAIINPTYIDWLLHSDDLEGSVDLTQHYLGWVFYRRSPWHFPFGLTEGIYATPISVIYTDSIPLFAFFFKLLSPVLPADFQYFGIYGLMCYCLMGGFSALLVKRSCDSPLVHISTAIIFVSNPVMLNRMFLHTALSGHFLIVAGLCLYFYDELIRPRQRLILWTILISCGTLINAYFAPMLFLMLFFTILADAGKAHSSDDSAEKISAISRIFCLCTPVAVTAILCWCFGMFYGSVPATAGGLYVLSFNLNGFFNPMTKLTDFHDHIMGYKDMNYSRYLPELPISTAYQNEGFSYLGIGVIALLLFVILVAVSKPLSGTSSDAADSISPTHRRCLLVCMIIFVLLALSPAATLGENTIYSLPLPELIYNLWSSFRSTARFIWPVYYCLLAMPFLYLGGKLSTHDLVSGSMSKPGIISFYIVMLSSTALQLVDLSPGFTEKYSAFHSIDTYQSSLINPVWEELGLAHDDIIFYPPTEYGLYEDGKASVEFEIYALRHDLSLNNSYMSRNLCDVADAATMEHFKSRAEGASYPRTIYIFFDCMSEDELPDPAVYHLTYYHTDGYTVGVE